METGVSLSLFAPQDWPEWQAPPPPAQGVQSTPTVSRSREVSLPVLNQTWTETPGHWFSEPLSAFDHWLRAPQANRGRGFSEDTQKVYGAMWGKFVRFCVDHGVSAALANEGVLLGFLGALNQERIDMAHARGNTQAVRALDGGGVSRQARRYLALLAKAQAHLVDIGVRPDNPALFLLERFEPEPDRPLASPLKRATDLVLHKVLVERPSSDWRTLRDRAIVDVLVGTGLTSRQLRSLNDDPAVLDLTAEPPWVSPVPARRGQGRPGRVPLTPEAAASLREWLAQRRQAIAGTVLFPGTLAGRPMSAASLYRAVAHAMALAQAKADQPVADHLGPRTLRHTFATRQLRAGRPLEVLQQWLGHRNVSSTAVYQRLVPDPQGFQPV